jgi:hypothetical protein
VFFVVNITPIWVQVARVVVERVPTSWLKHKSLLGLLDWKRVYIVVDVTPIRVQVWAALETCIYCLFITFVWVQVAKLVVERVPPSWLKHRSSWSSQSTYVSEVMRGVEPDSPLPWHRVVRSDGTFAPRSMSRYRLTCLRAVHIVLGTVQSSPFQSFLDQPVNLPSPWK